MIIHFMIEPFQYFLTVAKMGKNKAFKNAFFYFMMELKSKQGNHFKNNEEAAKAADPLWRVSLIKF